MSMDRCNDCSRLVDTDSDCGAYYQQLPNGAEIELDFCRCEWCRDKEYEAQEFHDLGDAMAAKAEDINQETGRQL